MYILRICLYIHIYIMEIPHIYITPTITIIWGGGVPKCHRHNYLAGPPPYIIVNSGVPYVTIIWGRCKIKNEKLQFSEHAFSIDKTFFFQLQASMTPENVVFSRLFAYTVHKPLFLQWFSYTLTEISWYAWECLPGACGPSWISLFWLAVSKYS